MPVIHQLKDKIFWLHVWLASVVTWSIDILIGQTRPIPCYYTRNINKNSLAHSKNRQELYSEYYIFDSIIEVVISRRNSLHQIIDITDFFFKLRLPLRERT